jgi:hypothetical protein
MLQFHTISRFPGNVVNCRLCDLSIHKPINHIRRCAMMKEKDCPRYEKIVVLKTMQRQELEKENQILTKDLPRELMVRLNKELSFYEILVPQT